MPAVFLPKQLIDSRELSAGMRADPQAVIETAEERYRRDIEALARSLADSGCSVAMLSGPSASGKTTSAHKLAETLGRLGRPTEVVSLDDFFLNIAQYPLDENGEKDYESPYALNLAEFSHCMEQLLRERQALFPLFDFTTQSRRAERRPVSLSDSGMLLIEGIHALNPLLFGGSMPAAVTRVYIGLRNEYRLPEGLLTTREIRIVRRLIRDDRFRAYPPDRTLAVWDGIVRGEERWIKPFKTQADLLLNASFAYEPCLYRRIIESFADGQPAGVYRDTLNDLARKLACFEPADEALVPPDATIREFIG